MLNWITGYPTSLRSRYRQKTACFTKMYILTNAPLEQQYPCYQRDDPATWQAFLQRIHKVRIFGTGGTVADYNSVDDYLHHRRDAGIQDTNKFFSRISHPLEGYLGDPPLSRPKVLLASGARREDHRLPGEKLRLQAQFFQKKQKFCAKCPGTCLPWEWIRAITVFLIIQINQKIWICIDCEFYSLIMECCVI